MQRRRVSIRDVGRAAGVSTTTVSDALSGRGRMAEETRARVVAVADELGYVASSAARSLRLGRSGAIGLYVPDRTVGYEYYTNLARGAAEEAMGHGLALTLLPRWEDHEQLRALHLDGIVVSDPAVGDSMLKVLGDLPVPLVTCERDLTPDADHAGVVRSDHVAGIDQLLEHLAGQGAARVGVICPEVDTAFGWEVRRGCERRDDLELRLVDVPLVTGAEVVTAAADTLLDWRPDAIVAVADGSAMSVLHRVGMRGLRVPDDVLLASYVDAPSLQMSNPPLTAVDIDPRRVGREAAALVAAILAGERKVLRDVVIPTAVRARLSTGAA